MRKTIVLLLALHVIVVAQGQNIPNGDFENWSTKNEVVIDQWVSSGDVTATTDAYEGSKALKLTNTASTERRGYVATGAFSQNKLQGIPYDEKPLSIRFRAKYDLALGDRAQVAVLFYLKGNAIAFSSTYIEGSSKDTFNYFSVPITWNLSTQPDSVGIVMSSLDLETQDFNGDGYIIIDDFHFATISTRNKEVPNGDFEDWSTKSREVLSSWFTTDDFLREILPDGSPVPFVTKSNKGRSGTKAIELQSHQFGTDIIPGMVIVGDHFVDNEEPTFPVSKRWKYLEGYYQYKPVQGDSAFFGAFFFKNGIAIGGTQFAIDKEATSYTYFAKEISFFSSVTPDSAVVFIASANPDNPRGNGSWLLVDDIQFSDQNSSVFNLDMNKLSVYPNPFNNYLKIDGTDQMLGAEYRLLDLLGKPVKSGVLTRNLIIDMSSELPGVYVLQIAGKHINTSKIVVKE